MQARRWSGSLEREPELRRAVRANILPRAGRPSRSPAGSPAKPAARCNHESIYRFIYAQIARTKDYRWRHYLPRGKSKRGFRGRKGGSSGNLD